MMPEEVADAAVALGAKKLLPVHWGKFTLALHPWDEPVERLMNAATGKPFELLTPMLGETIQLDSDARYENHWWQKRAAKPEPIVK